MIENEIISLITKANKIAILPHVSATEMLWLKSGAGIGTKYVE